MLKLAETSRLSCPDGYTTVCIYQYLMLLNCKLKMVKIVNCILYIFSQFSSVTQSCLALCNPMDYSIPGLPVHRQHWEFTQTHVHCVSDVIQSSHPLSSPSLPASNLSQIHGLFKWDSSSHQVAKVLEFQLQHQSFQCWILAFIKWFHIYYPHSVKEETEASG